MELWPVYVPSKGRPSPPTAKLLSDSDIPFVLVVEPQDYSEYNAQNSIHKTGSFAQLDLNNQGIAYVRNAIIKRAQDAQMSWYWMFDDDIKSMGVSLDGKTIKADPKEVLLNAQRILTSVAMVGQGALEYQQFSWSAKKEYAFGYCDVAVAINLKRLGDIRYRPEMNLKEDRDFTLQILTSGSLTVRCSKLWFSAPKNGSNKGGLYDEYRQGKEEAASKRMEEAWPGICKFNKKPDGRPDVKIDWKRFKPR